MYMSIRHTEDYVILENNYAQIKISRKVSLCLISIIHP